MIFRPDIQGLRAFAVLAVILFHFNPAWLPGGFVGVDIFFVISGFLIASILLKKQQSEHYNLASTLTYFYTSRFKRIVPAYMATLALVAIVSAILFIPQDFKVFKESAEQALWFSSNNYFANFGDYFAPANHEQPLLHTWSLAIEIQFYLLAPFILLLTPRKWLATALVLTSTILLAIAEYRLRALQIEQQTYYSLYARLPEFFVGALVALFLSKKPLIKNNALQVLGLAAIVVSIVFQPKLGPFPGLLVLLPTFGAALLLASQPASQPDRAASWLLSNKTSVWIGTLSYSLYLWHWPVLAFLRYYTGAEILPFNYGLLFFALTLMLSILSFYLVEEPLRGKAPTKIRYLGYASLVAVIVITGWGYKKVNTYLSPPPLPEEYTRYGDDTQNCHGHIVGDCLRGDLTSNKEVLVLGDSHAAMLNHFFDYLGKKFGFKARVITASSCITIPGFDYQRIAEWAHKPCLSQIDEAQKYIQSSQVIFLAAFWVWQFESEKNKMAVADFIKNVKQPVFIISQEPLLKKHPIRSLKFEHLGLPSKPMTIDPGYITANNTLMDIAKNSKSTKFLELNTLPMFNTAPIYNGELMYYDEHHLNEVAAIEYAKQAQKLIEKDLSNAF